MKALAVSIISIGFAPLVALAAPQAAPGETGTIAPMTPAHPVPPMAPPAPAAKPKVACTMTFNSSDEKRLFRKYLKDFRFVELGPEGTNSNDWLAEACQTGVQCDLLIISGHFDGDFFGENTSGWTSIDEFENLSCRSRCAGIFRKPKEVFLFGCNTLSGDDDKFREIEKYIKAQIAMGRDRATAETMAEGKYPPSSDSFFDKMRRTFRVPKLYGFNDLAPTGSTIAPYLNHYLQAITAGGATYGAHLGQIASGEANTVLKASLKEMSFIEAHGATKAYRNPTCSR